MTFKIPLKRLRKTSSPVSIANQRNYPHTPPLASSSPIPPTLSVGRRQQHPSKRVNLHPSSNHGDITAALPMGDLAPFESDSEVQEREESDSLEHIVMAIDLRDRESVGCAYYVAREEKLYCMEDIKYGGLEIMNMCKCFPIVHPR